MRRTLVSVFSILALFAACDDAGGGTDVPGDTHGGPGPDFTVVSFNTGLAAGYVDYAPDRLPLIGPALAALEADVICLQEVWTDDDNDALIEATKTAFPYRYRKVTEDTSGGGEAACTSTELDPLAACATTNCAEEPPENLGTCVLSFCGTEFGGITEGCQTCLVSQLGKPLSEMVTACTTGSGGQYAYEGRNGVLLLSKHPFAATQYKEFPSYLNVRVALHARVQDPQMGNVDVFCTHLTADLSDVNYGGTYDSWGDEQGAQADALVQWIEAEREAVVVVLTGDLNCGPAIGDDIAAEHAENYDKFTAASYVDPYAASAGVTCTWCGDNPLVGGGASSVIDHVLVRGSGFQAEAERVLDTPVTLPGPPEVQTRLSDHYGVSVTVTVPLI
jgi:endonuclease/exonuclease/phosphatase family metal-dependent hydrolase